MIASKGGSRSVYKAAIFRGENNFVRKF